MALGYPPGLLHALGPAVLSLENTKFSFQVHAHATRPDGDAFYSVLERRGVLDGNVALVMWARPIEHPGWRRDPKVPFSGDLDELAIECPVFALSAMMEYLLREHRVFKAGQTYQDGDGSIFQFAAACFSSGTGPWPDLRVGLPDGGGAPGVLLAMPVMSLDCRGHDTPVRAKKGPL